MTRITNNLKSFTMPTSNSLVDMADRHFHLFDEIFREATNSSKIVFPYNTMLINDNTYRIEIALAGYSKEDIEVYIEDDTLFVNGKTTETVKDDSYNKLNVTSYPHYIHKGISAKTFNYNFGIPKNSSTFEAKFINGILTVDITTEKPKSKRFSLTLNSE